ILVPAAESTALDLQHLSTEVSTHVLAPDVAPPEDDEGLHFRDLWRIVVKRKWVVFAVIVLALATALVSTMMQTPIYRATITLKIEREAAKIVDFKGGPVTPEEYGDADFYRTQYELLKSRTLAERVVEQLNLRNIAPKKEGPRPWWLTLLRRDAAPGEEEGATAMPEGAGSPSRLAV